MLSMAGGGHGDAIQTSARGLGLADGAIDAGAKRQPPKAAPPIEEIVFTEAEAGLPADAGLSALRDARVRMETERATPALPDMLGETRNHQEQLASRAFELQMQIGSRVGFMGATEAQRRHDMADAVADHLAFRGVADSLGLASAALEQAVTIGGSADRSWFSTLQALRAHGLAEERRDGSIDWTGVASEAETFTAGLARDRVQLSTVPRAESALGPRLQALSAAAHDVEAKKNQLAALDHKNAAAARGGAQGDPLLRKIGRLLQTASTAAATNGKGVLGDVADAARDTVQQLTGGEAAAIKGEIAAHTDTAQKQEEKALWQALSASFETFTAEATSVQATMGEVGDRSDGYLDELAEAGREVDARNRDSGRLGPHEDRLQPMGDHLGAVMQASVLNSAAELEGVSASAARDDPIALTDAIQGEARDHRGLAGLRMQNAGTASVLAEVHALADAIHALYEGRGGSLAGIVPRISELLAKRTPNAAPRAKGEVGR